MLLVLMSNKAAAQQKDTLNQNSKVVVQTDTTKPLMRADSLVRLAPPVYDSKVDSVVKVHSPRKAAIRSAILPGWGQIYNGKYWKLPIVYGALGVSGYVFFTNIQTYRDLRFAYQAKYKASLPVQNPNDPSQRGPFRDTSDLIRIKPEYMPYDQESLRYNRNNFRKYIDYSFLFFIALWGLNVVDATVDAHLKAFDVSPDLSLRFKAGYFDVARTGGVGLVLTFK
ncbi:DUF5683 domain-containing protein [Paracnuella aquatica]|uniref:DUF5683 domain-containing protein n=1 Tax=Paracnuella aquatica TaxID=2268757 RepID=UPI000DEF5ABD|nr:DUF5683 domain-containing protein [Paracnuella aquatica]RPD51570.1 hypothetical protein DRJ53_02510 [Paracnuella aquatica]